MAYILFLWTVVAATDGYMRVETVHRDWRPMSEFTTKKACETAATELAIKADRFRCIKKGE